MRTARIWAFAALLISAVLVIGALVAWRLLEPEDSGPGRSSGPSAVPVEVVRVVRGPIERRRVFSGSLQSAARATVAPKIAGRIVSMPLDIADTVERGQVVARLDGDEYRQLVAQAEADFEVAEANVAAAKSADEIAQRELERIRTLQSQGVAAESELDRVLADAVAKAAQVRVAEAQRSRAEAQVEAARIRLGYASIVAEWEGGDDERVVAERMAEVGDTVSPNTPLLSIVELDPIEAVVFVTERDYAAMKPGLAVSLRADAFPGRTWTGAVARVAPVFREGSRQARVEISVPNEDLALKPGMFVRVEAILERIEDAIVAPASAVTRRNGGEAVFMLRGGAAVLTPVTTGVRDGERVQLIAEDESTLDGEVVTLGQQLLDDGVAVTVPERAAEDESSGLAGR